MLNFLEASSKLEQLTDVIILPAIPNGSEALSDWWILYPEHYVASSDGSARISFQLLPHSDWSCCMAWQILLVSWRFLFSEESAIHGIIVVNPVIIIYVDLLKCQLILLFDAGPLLHWSNNYFLNFLTHKLSWRTCLCFHPTVSHKTNSDFWSWKEVGERNKWLYETWLLHILFTPNFRQILSASLWCEPPSWNLHSVWDVWKTIPASGATAYISIYPTIFLTFAHIKVFAFILTLKMDELRISIYEQMPSVIKSASDFIWCSSV